MPANTAGRTEPRPRSHQRGDAHQCYLTLLGGFAASCRSDPLLLPPTASRLLALLALHRGLIDRRRLALDLWPDATEGKAATRVRHTLWQLRGACPALVAEDASFLALGEDVVVDVTEIGMLARRLTNPGDTDPALVDVDPQRLTAELLPRWTEDWLLAERDHLRSRALGALEALAERLIDAGRALDALDVAYLAAGADPLRETTVQVLMRAHLAVGNRVDALRAYSSFTRRLSDELGLQVRPLAETSRILRDGFEAGTGPHALHDVTEELLPPAAG